MLYRVATRGQRRRENENAEAASEGEVESHDWRLGFGGYNLPVARALSNTGS